MYQQNSLVWNFYDLFTKFRMINCLWNLKLELTWILALPFQKPKNQFKAVQIFFFTVWKYLLNIRSKNIPEYISFDWTIPWAISPHFHTTKNQVLKLICATQMFGVGTGEF